MKLLAADVRRAVRQLYPSCNSIEAGLRPNAFGDLTSNQRCWRVDGDDWIDDLHDLCLLGDALDHARSALRDSRGLSDDTVSYGIYAADLYCYSIERKADRNGFRESELLGNVDLVVYRDGTAAVVDQSTGETFVVNRTPSSDRQSGGDV